MEIRALGGAEFDRALDHFRRGEPVRYRGMALVLRGTAFECRVTTPAPGEGLPPRRALEALLGARYRLGALLASAPPLAAIVGNREPRFVLVAAATDEELYELRGDRLRRLAGGGPPAP